MPNENPITPLSAEEKVKAKWPDAYCAANPYLEHSEGLNFAIKYHDWMAASAWMPTKSQAWADAASRLGAGSHAQ